MSARRTRKPSKAADRPSRGRADLARLRAEPDAEVMRNSPPELADLPASFWRDAELVEPVAKEAISLRVDQDVVTWFREQGPRYQSRMNAVLRAFMEHTAEPARPAVVRDTAKRPRSRATPARKR